MITLHEFNRKTKLPEADYIIEKTEKLQGIIDNLTPKFEGKWIFLIIDPKLKFVETLISGVEIPEWIHLELFMNQKKIEAVCLKHPKLQPKQVTKKDNFQEAIASVKHLVSKQAAKVLYQALGSNPSELENVLSQLDNDCPGDIITYKQVQSVINYTKQVYASDVLNAFMQGDINRWNLYNTLVHNVGKDIAYFAMYKYSKSLLLSKNDFLQNKDVKNYIVKRVDAPLICYVYTLFSNSSTSDQLICILNSIENRSSDRLNFILESE